MNVKHLARSVLAAIADSIHSYRGFRFPDYFVERHRIEALIYGIEPDVSRLLNKRLTEGMTVLDVGGNVGLICRICSKRVGTRGKVWTFEPDPYTRKFLEHNVSRCSNVTVSPIALSDENSLAKLHIHPASGTSNSLLNFEASIHSVEVQCQTMDSFLEAHPEIRPDWVKIDVEGAEPKVLNGMKKTIARFPKLFLILEFCPNNLANGGYTSADFFHLLDELGLLAEIISDDGSTFAVANLNDLMTRLGSKVYCNLLCYRTT